MKTSSLNQPENNLRAQHIFIIKDLVDRGLSDMARVYDTKNKVGFFDELDELNKKPWQKWLDKFITVNPAMLTLKQDIISLMSVNDSVLIIGETGTGKELIAHALHGSRIGNFVAINCAGLPEYLLESELFGHVKGAFSGAISDKPGLFKVANEGTVFLDEIGDMPYDLQAKLLRAIQEKSIRKVGANSEEPISCRIIAATHHNIRELTAASLVPTLKFRKDLYERLSTFELHTLPLRKRLEDVPLILENLLGNDKHSFPKLEYHTMDLSGNVRTLQKLVRRYKVLKRL